MFRVVVGLVLAFTVGWKVLSITNNRNERHDFKPDLKPMLIAFLTRQHFAASQASGTDGVEAIAGDCRLLIIGSDTKIWEENVVNELASTKDRIFFVYHQKVYTNLPTWSIVINKYWSSFLSRIEFKRSSDSLVLAIIASERCNAERLPWYEFLPST